MQVKQKFILYTIIILLITIITGCIFLHSCQTHQEDEKQIDETVYGKKKIIVTIEKNIDEYKNTIETETDKEEDANQAIKPISLGEFKLTAYCSCYQCCGKWANNRPKDENGNDIIYGSIGEVLKVGYSIAVDPTVIPYNTEVIINGNVYKAQDCGGAIKGNRIDMYVSNHNAALEFGVQYAEVFMVPK